MAVSGKSIFDVIGSDPVRISAPPLQASAPAPAKAKPNWVGIIADALAGAMGREGPYAAMMQRERAAEQEEAQWTRRQQSELGQYEQKKQIDQRYGQADVAPMLRDAQAWQQMTPEQRAAYGEMQKSRQGDPDVTVTLPNGQFYAGPRSGLAQALMGGGAPPPAPTAPVGKLRPLNGGPTPPASGTFRPAR